MATLQAILQKETFDGTVIHLYREGMFLKGYEQSAYLFSMHIKPEYQVKAKHYKTVHQWIVSIGFPAHALASLVGDCTTVVTEEGVDVLLKDLLVEPEAYTSWKEEHIRIC